MRSISRLNIHLIAVFLLTCASLLIFTKSLDYPFTRLDDYSYVVSNGDIRRIDLDMAKRWFTTDYVLLYIPVTMASFAADYQIWKLNPFGYRFTNLLLHTLNSFLIYFLLAEITGSWLVAFWVSLIFTIHPVQIESVTWITERKNVLSTFFLLLAFLMYRKKFIVPTVVTFILALLSKPSVSIFPILLLAYDYFKQSSLTGKKRLLFYALMFGASALIALITVKYHSNGEFYFRGGGFWTNVFVMLTVFFKYIKLMLFPQSQQIFYMSQVFQSFWHWPVVLSAAGVLLILATVVWHRKSHPIISFGVVWYLIFMVPVSNILFPIATLMNDRYLYVALVGFFLAVCLVIDKVTGKMISTPQNTRQRIISACLLLVFILPFARQSTARLEDWKDPVGIYNAARKGFSQNDPRLKIGRAIDLYAKRDIEASIRELDSVLEHSESEEPLLWQVQNYLTIGDFDRAGEYLQKVDRLPGDTRTAAYHDFYGQFYEHKQEYDLAEKYYLNSIKIDKKIPAYIHLAQLYIQAGRIEDAERTFETALNLDPDSSDALVEACKLYLDLRNYDRAFELYERLHKLYPDDPFVVQIGKLMRRYSK